MATESSVSMNSSCRPGKRETQPNLVGFPNYQARLADVGFAGDIEGTGHFIYHQSITTRG
jgi:hypothetical protein